MAHSLEEGTVRPAQPFDPETDCNHLRKAMKGLGTDEKAIIEILCRRTNVQRQELRKLFKTMFGRDLVSDLKEELSGKFEDIIVGLMTPSAEYDAMNIRKAIEGAGTDEEALVEILSTRTNADLEKIKATYKSLFHREMEKDLSSDTSGDFRHLLVSLSAAGRQEQQTVNPEKARADAQALFDAGKGKVGTDESVFNRILCSQSYAQLRVVFDEYQKIAGCSIEDTLKSELSGTFLQGMLAIVNVVRNKPAYFAERLHHAMAGAGTKDMMLVRILVTRCEVDMVQIKREFQRLYGKTLESFIEDDTSGDYKRAMLALVR